MKLTLMFLSGYRVSLHPADHRLLVRFRPAMEQVVHEEESLPGGVRRDYTGADRDRFVGGDA